MGATNSSNRVGPKPKPGDLIEIFSNGLPHWAVYVGRDYVVHVTGVDGKIPGFELILMGNVQGIRAMVKKELLSEVTAGFKYQVNNKHDGQRRLRSPENIVQIALALVGQKWPYILTQENCEHFAIELRYGESIYNQNRVCPEPKPGDLIEIFCSYFEYWAVYVGCGYVVHVTGADIEIPGMEWVMVMSAEGTRAVVKKQLLSEVAEGCEYRVRNKHDGKRRVRSCKEIVQMALARVGQEWPYSFTQKNCKHFAMELRYGEPISNQNRVAPVLHPGDLIEISLSLFEHWAVYVEDGYVVHLTGVNTQILGVESVVAASVEGCRTMVKKERLSEVVVGCEFRVNNKHDGKRRVRSPQEIVQMALACVGQEWPYSFTRKNCKHFAMELRYGELISDQKRVIPVPKSGDLIEIFCGYFEHWAVHVGDGYVVHVTGIDTEIPGVKSVMASSVQGTRAVVKKEQLLEVAAVCEFRVNNKHDGKRRVRSPEEIVQIALACVGQEWPYSFTRKNCKHFAMELRYGELFYDERRFGPEPKPGDLIEFFRNGKLSSLGLEYQHWAVYVGNGHVVHVTNPDPENLGVEWVMAAARQGIQAMVKKEPLLEVAAGCIFRVNNKHDMELSARPAAEIVQKASALVGQERYYSLIHQNCEHFATELRYGVARSDQVEEKKDAILKWLSYKGNSVQGNLVSPEMSWFPR